MREHIIYIVRQRFDTTHQIKFSKIRHFSQDSNNHEIQKKCLNTILKDENTELQKFIDVSKLHRCAWCGEPNLKILFSFKLLQKQTKQTAQSVTTTYLLELCDFLYYEHDRSNYENLIIRKDDDMWGKHACFPLNNNCPRKGLNSNSIEYVQRQRGLSTEDAHSLILSRNSQPFYSHNHAQYDDYKIYQDRFRDKTEEEKQSLVDKQNFQRSLDGYIQKYGENEGRDKWLEIQKSKGLTLDKFVFMYGVDEGKRRYDDWIEKTRSQYETFVKRFGPDLAYQEWIKYKAKFSGQKFGQHYRTDRGELLRQQHEKNFYDIMKEYDLHLENYKMEINYPSSRLLTDFFFEDIGLYVEIAGLMQNHEYAEKMKFKQDNFGAIICLPYMSDMRILCKQIRKRIDDVRKNSDSID